MSPGFKLTLLPLIGTMDMDSTPPASTTSCNPACTARPPVTMACSPLEQKRLMVCALTLFGSPARNTALRAMFRPCSASGMAQPSTTSCTSSLRKPGTRRTAAASTKPAKSSGRVSFKLPFTPRPTGVRSALAMITFKGNEGMMDLNS
jgi:hypothetical protein